MDKGSSNIGKGIPIWLHNALTFVHVASAQAAIAFFMIDISQDNTYNRSIFGRWSNI